jgi:hypothetical protein
MREFENKMMMRDRKQQELGGLYEEELHNLYVHSLPTTSEQFEEAVKRDMRAGNEKYTTNILQKTVRKDTTRRQT